MDAFGYLPPTGIALIDSVFRNLAIHASILAFSCSTFLSALLNAEIDPADSTCNLFPHVFSISSSVNPCAIAGVAISNKNINAEIDKREVRSGDFIAEKEFDLP
jgi:hypothetical protein